MKRISELKGTTEGLFGLKLTQIKTQEIDSIKMPYKDSDQNLFCKQINANKATHNCEFMIKPGKMIQFARSWHGKKHGKVY